MAFESIAALQFAGNLVPFFGLGCRLFFTSRKLYNFSEGVLAENAELEVIATSIKKVSEDFIIGPIRERLLSSPGNRT